MSVRRAQADSDVPVGHAGGLRAAFRAELRSAARPSTLSGGLIALVAFPVWSLFDYVLLPGHFSEFQALRVLTTGVMVVCWMALRSPRLGGRWPEHFAMVLALVPEVAIAWMLPVAGDELEAYLLGFSLALYASAFVILWRWQLTLLLVALSALAMVAAFALRQPVLTAPQVTLIAFYLSTAAALAFAGQVYRNRAAWQSFQVKQALADEHRHSQRLLVEVTRLSYEDDLTGLGNHRAWTERLKLEVLRARRYGAPLTVIFGDFDHFKDVNDRFGHDVGDAVLALGARVLTERVRETDYVARLGGDEFAIVCPGTTLHDAMRLASDLLARARAARWPEGVRVTFSLGVAELDPTDQGADELARRADIALYAAKVTRDTVAISEPEGVDGVGLRP